MSLEAGPYIFEWQPDWAKVPDAELAERGWAHHGMAFNAAGEILTLHPALPRVLVLDQGGKLQRTFDVPVIEAHGMALESNGRGEFLWIADNGRKRSPDHEYAYLPDPPVGKAVRVDFNGQVDLEIGAPDLAVYGETFFSPTSVAVADGRAGGSGDIWVADGYGASLVHRFDSSGRYQASIDGSLGAGRFNCPHALWIDRRREQPELLVADRANGRIQVFDLEGRFIRAFGRNYLDRPTVFAAYGEHLLLGELNARIAIIDRDDKLVGFLGDNSVVASLPGWPNELDDNDVPRRTSRLREGLFNSPHGVTADQAGNIYVTEWLIGGRYTKLRRVS
jgi:hypothetical protein